MCDTTRAAKKEHLFTHTKLRRVTVFVVCLYYTISILRLEWIHSYRWSDGLVGVSVDILVLFDATRLPVYTFMYTVWVWVCVWQQHVVACVVCATRHSLTLLMYAPEKTGNRRFHTRKLRPVMLKPLNRSDTYIQIVYCKLQTFFSSSLLLLLLLLLILLDFFGSILIRYCLKFVRAFAILTLKTKTSSLWKWFNFNKFLGIFVRISVFYRRILATTFIERSEFSLKWNK